jgi:hypothetical protein
MRSDTLIKTFHAEAPLEAYRLVTFATGINAVEMADAVTDPLLGVSTSVGSQDNGRCDVIVAGVSEVVIGGTVSRGDVLTTDASGRAVLSTQITDRVVGMALADAVVDDIAAMLIAQG